MIAEKYMEQILLDLLKNPTVRYAIRNICKENDGIKAELHDVPEKTARSSKDTAEYNKLMNQHENLQRDYSQVETQLKEKNLELQKLSLELEQCQDQLAKLKNQNKMLQSEMQAIKEENEKLAKLKAQNEKLQSDMKAVKAEKAEMEKRVSDALEAFNAFMGLSENDKSSLDNNFTEESLLPFVINGSDWKNIIDIWEYCKYEFNRGNLESRDNLLCMLRFFLDIHNRSHYTSPKYAWQSVETGDRFDGELYEGTQDSRISGVVTEVLLPGIVACDDPDTIVRKSLVEVR